MSWFRWVLIAAVAATVGALVGWWPGSAPLGTGEPLGAGVPAGGAADARSSTWYCAAGTWGEEDAPPHRLEITNPAGVDATARLSVHDAEGPVGEQEVDVTGPGPTTVDLENLFDGRRGLSVMVESDVGELVVEHRLVSGGRADQVPCATSSSDRWYFPAQTTLLDTTAQLVLFNPFASDAAVDLSVAIDEGVRIPGEWQGLVVPAGTTRTVDLGAEGDEFGIQRRDQFSVTVQARTGRVIAETVQTLDTDEPATRGIRLQPGVPRAATSWAFAQGYVDEGASERLVVYNPGESPASVAVQITPFGGAAEPPEPFELEVAPRRYQQLDLSAETRIPARVPHAIAVESTGAPVVVGRVVTIGAEPEEAPTAEALGRPDVSSGTTIGTGTPVAAPLWLATVRANPEDGAQNELVMVHNPGDDDVVVSMTVFSDDVDGVVLLDEGEIPAGDSLAVPVSGDLGGGWLNVLVEATGPVVVERTITYSQNEDLSMPLAVPLRSGGPLTPVTVG